MYMTSSTAYSNLSVFFSLSQLLVNKKFDFHSFPSKLRIKTELELLKEMPSMDACFALEPQFSLYVHIYNPSAPGTNSPTEELEKRDKRDMEML